MSLFQKIKEKITNNKQQITTNKQKERQAYSNDKLMDIQQANQEFLRYILKIDNSYTPLASNALDRLQYFELISTALSNFQLQTNLQLLLFSDSLSYSQLIADLIIQNLADTNAQTNGFDHQAQITVDIFKISEQTCRIKKQTSLILQTISDALKNYYEQYEQNPKIFFITFHNIHLLNNFQISNIRQKIYQKHRLLQSVNFILTCPVQHIRQCMALDSFTENKLIFYLKSIDDKNTKNLIIQKFLSNLQNKFQQFYGKKQLPHSIEYYTNFIEKNQVLQTISNDISNIPLLTFIIPFIQQKLEQNQYNNNKFTRYEIFDLFIEKYMLEAYKILVLQKQQVKVLLQSHYQQSDESLMLQLLFKDALLLMVMLSWKILQNKQNTYFQQLNFAETINKMNSLLKTDITQIESILLFLIPACCQNVAKSIVIETRCTTQNFLDENFSLLNQTFISKDLEILRIVGEYVMELPLIEQQYPKFYEVWYRSVLLSRKIRTDIIKNSQKINELQHLASNCISLLASTPHCDLTQRDFSECAIPSSQLSEKDISQTDMRQSQFKCSNIHQQYIQQKINSESKYYKNSLALQSYSGEVNSVSFSADGRLIASAGTHQGVMIWSVESIKQIALLRGNSYFTKSLQFSADSKLIAVANNDKTIKLWSVQKKRLIYSLNGSTNTVQQFQFSPNSQILASCGAENTIKLWDTQSKTEIAILKGHSKQVYQVAFSSDSKMLASGSDDKQINIWDLQRKIIIRTIQGENFQVAFSPNCQILAWGSDSCNIKLLIFGQNQVNSLIGHQSNVWSLAFSKDQKILASGSRDCTIKLWDVQSLKLITTFNAHQNGVYSIAFSPDSKILASSGNNIYLWDVQKKQQINPQQGHQDTIYSVAFTRDSKFLASGSFDSTIKVWSVQSKTEISCLKGHLNNIYAIAFSPDQKILASGGQDQTVRLWDWQKSTEIVALKGHSSWVYSLAFSRDSKMIVSGSWGSTIKLWDVESRSEVYNFTGNFQKVFVVTFSPDLKLIASGSYDNTVRLWSVEDKQQVACLQGHLNTVCSVVFQLDSQILASGSWDNSIKLWNVKSRSLLATLKGHTRSVNSLAFCSEYNILLSGSSDKNVIMWDLNSKKQIATLNQNQNTVYSIAISPDDKNLAVGGSDKSAKFWTIDFNKIQSAESNEYIARLNGTADIDCTQQQSNVIKCCCFK